MHEIHVNRQLGETYRQILVGELYGQMNVLHECRHIGD